MSRNKSVDYTQYVFSFYDEVLKQKRYAIAKLDSDEYYRPATKQETLSYGIKEFRSKDIRLMGSYPSRRQALRRARYLFGGK